MTKVVRDHLIRSSSTSSAATFTPTESTADSSAGVRTPRSESTISFNMQLVDGNTPDSQVRSTDGILASSSADQPIPSTESNLDGPFDDSCATITTPSSTTPTSRSPSVAANDKGKGKAVLREGYGNDSINAPLENMRISSPDSSLGMSDVAAAIGRISSSPVNQTTLIEPMNIASEGSTCKGQPSSRRSSSRANIIPYDVRGEETPQHAFHDPAFQQAFSEAKGLISELLNVLGSSSLHTDPDTTIQRLHKEAGDLAHFQCPSSRTVGFVGDSGVGKSSLLNSLLDFCELARASNGGEACTCVVTEYHYHDSETFVIEKEFFSIDEIQEQITELLQSFRHYHLNGTTMDAEEKEHFKKIAQIARDTFRAMFRSRLDNEQFLTREPEDSVLRTLHSWIQDIAPLIVGGREVRMTLKDCSDCLMKLTSEQNSAQEPAVWPYVRKIKVFVKAHILSTGLVLVDLPGLRDLNSARQKATERYLLQCNEIFAICHIGRAVTDKGVKSVFNLAENARLSNVGIICTRSDDIRANEAKHDWKGERSQVIQRYIDTMASDQLELDKIEVQLREFYEEDLSDEEIRKVWELTKCSLNFKKLMKNHESKLKEYLINTRNAIVKDKLKREYLGSAPGGELKVFCASNTDYWLHRDLSKDDAFPLLQLSGIIEIRKHCMSMVANSQLRAATKYIRDSIPAILSEIALWVQSGAGSESAEQKQAIRETLNALETRLRRSLRGSSSQFYGIARPIKQEFKTQVYDRQRIYEWSQGGRNAATEWSNWSAQSYMAFCRKYGKYCTEAVGSHNWNEEAIESMVGSLADPWQSFRFTLQNRNESLATSIEDLINLAIQYLEDGEAFHHTQLLIMTQDTELGEFSESTATLSQALRSRQRLLIADVEEVCQKLDASLSILRTDALSGIRTSLIGQAMESSYGACNAESGGGSDRRRKDIINRKLGSDSLFVDHMRIFRNRFNLLANDFETDLQAAVETHLDVIRGTLDIIRSENAASEAEQDTAFRGRVEAEITTATSGIRRIQAAVGL